MPSVLQLNIFFHHVLFRNSWIAARSLVLHWAALDGSAQTALQMALEAKAGSGAESGWISAGWSADGRMYPADCVIGNLPGGSMGAYYMSGYGDSDVAPTSSFALGSAEMLTSNGGTVMKFSRASGDGGAIPVDVAGVNTVIWAYSQSGSTALGFHGRNEKGVSGETERSGRSGETERGSVRGGGETEGREAKNGKEGREGKEAKEQEREVGLVQHQLARLRPFPDTSTLGSVQVDFTCSTAATRNNTSASTQGDDSQSLGATSAAESSGGSSSSSSACKASSLAGYYCMVQLSGDNFILHWTTNSTSTIALAAEAATSGWVSLGWSATGRMSPAEAAIGNLPAGTLSTGNAAATAVGAYSMTGYGASDVAVTGSFAVTNTAVETGNGRTVIKFERSMNDGEFPMSSSAVIWAYSRDNSQQLADHGPNAIPMPHSHAAFPCRIPMPHSYGSLSSYLVLLPWCPPLLSHGALPSSLSHPGPLPSHPRYQRLCYSQLCNGSIRVALLQSTLQQEHQRWGRGAAAALHSTPCMHGCSQSPLACSCPLPSFFSIATPLLSSPPSFPPSLSLFLAPFFSPFFSPSPFSLSSGSATINFATEASEVGEGSSSSATLYTVHAWLLTVAFGMLMPAAILVSRLFLADKPMPVHSTATGAASNPGASNGSAAAAGTAAAGGLGEPMLVEKHGGAAGAAEGGGSPLKGSLPSGVMAEDAPALVALSVGGPSAAAAGGGGGAGSGTAGGAAAATGGAVSKKPWVSKPMAFEVHKWLMLSAVLLALAGIIMAFVERGSQSLQSTHGQLGLAVMVLIVVQPIVGQLRPLKKHPSRPSWFALHWVIGVGTVAIAWVNTYLGFDLATSKFGYDLDSENLLSKLGGMLSFGGKPKKTHQSQNQALDHLSDDLMALTSRVKQANKRALPLALISCPPPGPLPFSLTTRHPPAKARRWTICQTT
ncbi:unnamed protein product [Closterium sp. Naga37s-1]|nr:unnamed protein product [Closterium sp. Naga37s-1]